MSNSFVELWYNEAIRDVRELILTIFFLILSIGLSGTIYYYAQLYEQWYYFFVPILLIPILYLILFVIYVILLFLISLCINKKKEKTAPNLFWYFWIKQTIFQLLFLSRTSVKIIGEELIDKKKRYLVVSNHISNFDPMVAIARLKLSPLICVSKIENFSIPICGSFIHQAGFIGLNRGDAHSGVQMVRKATEYLRKNYGSIFICPEGTRSKTGELLPFHPGSFKIATKAETDIAVCYIENTNLIAKNFPFKRTKVTLKIIKIIPKEEVLEKKTTELSLQAQQLIQKEKEKNKNELSII